MNNKILVPYGVKTSLAREFRVARPTLEKMLLGGHVRELKVKEDVRKRAIELGGVEVVNN